MFYTCVLIQPCQRLHTKKLFDHFYCELQTLIQSAWAKVIFSVAHIFDVKRQDHPINALQRQNVFIYFQHYKLLMPSSLMVHKLGNGRITLPKKDCLASTYTSSHTTNEDIFNLLVRLTFLIW